MAKSRNAGKETVRVEGLNDLLNALRALPAEIGSKGGGPIRSALFKATKIVRDSARARAPVRTGRLQKNIIAFRDKNPRGSGLTEAYYVTFRRGKKRRQRKTGPQYVRADSERDAYYGKFMEFGTSKMPAKPFLRPSFEENKRGALETYKKEMGAAISRAAKKLAKGPKRG